MMEVEVTTGAINLAKLQSNHHHQKTNRLNALSDIKPTASKHRREILTLTLINSNQFHTH